MAKKLISFDDTAPGTGLPSVVEQRLRDNLGGGDVGVALEGESGYPARPDTPLVIWRGSSDPREYPDFLTGVDLWAQTTPWTPPQVTWFTDFSDDTVGDIPTGWSVDWTQASVVATIADDAGTNVFRVGRTQLVSPGLTLVRWDEVPPTEDAEIVVRWRGITDGASYVPAAVRASGAVPTPTNYSAGFNSTDQMRIRANVASMDLSTVSPLFDTTYEVNQWRWTRFRIEGSTLAMRNWLDDTAEPTTWDTTVTDTRIPGPGHVGMLVTYQARTMEISQFGVGINGATAPVSA